MISQIISQLAVVYHLLCACEKTRYVHAIFFHIHTKGDLADYRQGNYYYNIISKAQKIYDPYLLPYSPVV